MVIFWLKLFQGCKSRALLCFISIFAAFSSTALFADAGIYAGGGLSNTAASEQNIDSSKSGFRLAAGYSFNDYFATEFGLVNTGNHTKLGMEGDGFSLSVLGQYPVAPNWKLFVEFGYVSLDLKIDEAKAPLDTDGNPSLTDGGDTGVLFGFGVSYDIQDWTVAFKTAEVDTDADLTLMSINLYRRF